MRNTAVIPLVSSAARTSSNTSHNLSVLVQDYKEMIVFLEVTAVSGTSPTLDVTIDTKNPITGQWHTLHTFSQMTSTGKQMARISDCLGAIIAPTWTIGGTDPSFTFSITVILKD